MKGKIMINIITVEDATQLIAYLNAAGNKTIKIKAKSDEGLEQFILAIADRKNTDQIIENIEELLPNSFYSIEDLRLTGQNHIPHLKKHKLMGYLELFKKHTPEK